MASNQEDTVEDTEYDKTYNPDIPVNEEIIMVELVPINTTTKNNTIIYCEVSVPATYNIIMISTINIIKNRNDRRLLIT